MVDKTDTTITAHELKAWPVYFDAIQRGDKTFEIRRDDRGFQRGDILSLRRYDPRRCCYTEPYEPLQKRISYVLTGGQLGIEPGYIVMGLQDVDQGSRSDTTEDGWRPLSELLNNPAHVVIRTPKDAGTMWRYLPYKPDARRQGYPHGRWQIATDYGFRNELLPKEGEWKSA